LGELLGQTQLQQGVSEIEIVLMNLIPARGQQLDLFIHRTGQRQRLDDVLKDLLARYGAGCFYQASSFDRTAPLLERRFQIQEMETP
jgi:hypothetical protein